MEQRSGSAEGDGTAVGPRPRRALARAPHARRVLPAARCLADPVSDAAPRRGPPYAVDHRAVDHPCPCCICWGPSSARAPPAPGGLARDPVAVWMVLVVLAPSFAWCAVPLFYTGLRILPPRAALALVALLTAFRRGAQLRLATGFDPNLVLAPPAVAAVATAVFVHMQRQAVRQRELAARQRELIDDLLRTRRELAATERREGTLAERQRLSMEIHDTLAQGLSSQQMLLQAARSHVGRRPAGGPSPCPYGHGHRGTQPRGGPPLRPRPGPGRSGGGRRPGGGPARTGGP